MTVSIQFTTPEEFKLLEPFLSQFRASGVSVQVFPVKKPRRKSNGKKHSTGLADKLYGIVRLPAEYLLANP